MSYRFAADEPVRDAISRCATEQLDRAVTELSERINEDPVAAVHNARKAIKRERSLLRLARGAMPSAQRRQENAALREAARSLAGSRDADVMVATVDDLAKRFAGQLPAGAFIAVRRQVKPPRRTAKSSALDAQAVQDLGAMRVRIDDWQLRTGGWNAVEDGLLRSYRRGRKAFRRAARSGSFQDLHAWRKRVKDLWYQERLLAPSCGPAVKGHAKDAHHVADLLGDDHDLGLLRARLTREPLPAPVDIDAIVTLIDHRRDELQTEAIALGRRLYAERPTQFIRRMRRSWKGGRAAAKAPTKQNPAELAAATRRPHRTRAVPQT